MSSARATCQVCGRYVKAYTLAAYPGMGLMVHGHNAYAETEPGEARVWIRCHGSGKQAKEAVKESA